MLLSYGPARYGPILSARCSPPPAAPGLSDPRPSAARAAGTPRSGDGKSRVWAASPIPVCRSLVGNAAAAVNRLPVPVSESRGRSYLISTVAPASSSRLFLVDALLDRLGRGLDKILRFLEAKARNRPDFLDDVDLLVADRGQDDVELGLLGRRLRGRRRGGAAGGGDGNRRRRRDAPFLFQHFRKLRRL